MTESCGSPLFLNEWSWQTVRACEAVYYFRSYYLVLLFRYAYKFVRS